MLAPKRVSSSAARSGSSGEGTLVAGMSKGAGGLRCTCGSGDSGGEGRGRGDRADLAVRKDVTEVGDLRDAGVLGRPLELKGRAKDRADVGEIGLV